MPAETASSAGVRRSVNRCFDQGTLGLTDRGGTGILLLRELADYFAIVGKKLLPIRLQPVETTGAANEISEFRLEPCSRRLTFRMPEPLTKSRFNPDAAKEKVT